MTDSLQQQFSVTWVNTTAFQRCADTCCFLCRQILTSGWSIPFPPPHTGGEGTEQHQGDKDH